LYFKKLELFGFKSFAEKTELTFEPGVTAIVGPNGCGKSNISDAIRWVMGEQSARELRGLRMEDVIFNGTDRIDPISFAEVSLTLSNESKIIPIEYDEITITRRVFRSGESEYLLNKNPVRLKDINELFMDTGLGSSAYAMIGQGKIDLILSSKPEERREIFEEASGITKYKSKKKEAMRKLEQTEYNLTRVNDIISEVKRQINSIERQAVKAQHYKEHFERLKEIEVKVLHDEYSRLGSQRNALLAELETLRANDQEKTGLFNSAIENLENMRQELGIVNQKFSEINEQVLNITHKIEKNNHTVKIDNERIQELSSRSAILDKETLALKEKLESLKLRVDSLRVEVNEASTKRQNKKDSIDTREALLVEMQELLGKSASDMSSAKVEIVDLLAAQTRIKNDTAKISANISNSGARHRRLSVEKEKVDEELGIIDKESSKVDSEVQELSSKVQSLRQEKESLDNNMSLIKQTLQELENNLRKSEEDLTISKSKLEFLEDLKKKHEGFSSGAKFVLKALEENSLGLSGICGAVANLIEVSPGYEIAVETALGNDAQSIIVENADIAENAIRLLKDKNAGVAKFIILNNIPDSNGHTESNGHKMLKDFVKADSRYKKAIDFMMRDVFVVDDLGEAKTLLNNGNVAITRSGEVATRTSYVGGSARQDLETGLIGRDARIRELSEKINTLSEEIAALKQKKDSQKSSEAEILGKIENISISLHQEEMSLSNKENEKNNIDTQKKRLRDEHSLLNLEIDEIAQEEETFKKRQEQLKEELVTAEQRLANLEELIRSSQELIASKSKEREGALVEITQLKTELASLDEYESRYAQNLNMLENSLETEMVSLYSKEKEIIDSRERIKQLQEEIVDLENENQQLFAHKETIYKEQGLTEQKRTELVRSISSYNEQVRALQSEVDGVRNRIRNLEVSDAELSFKKTSLKDRIEQAYKVDLETLPVPEVKEELDLPALSAEIEALKAKLEKMGTVNLVAIEEHQELKDRYNFLTTQQADLLSAKDQLIKAIQKINKTTKDLFMDGFQKVQITFKEYFRLLFGGGQAELVLLDESDVLESGIDIIVRPPGKKLQNISLLSGGEKALTAIALLFAMFKVKPSPFCVMDEIDAPLDESNIDRFTRVLQEFVKTSQFIVITHNKKTISMSDAMYGITMEETGVSKIVSVKFAEASAKTA